MTRPLAATLVALCLGGLALGRPAAVARADGDVPADACLYLPPSFADRVVFYQAFERGDGRPEINRIGAQLVGTRATVPDGFAGNGCRSARPSAGEAPLEVRAAALSPSRPLTVMRTWRLDAPMTETSSFQLIALLGRGHVSCFVHGAGEWCALHRPTMFVQIDSFPKIANVNQAVRDDAYFKPGEWHHVAVTIANASDVRFYLDGQPLVTAQAKGRPFGPDDVDAVQPSSDSGAAADPPMTTDDLTVVGRVLSPAEIDQYWRSAVSLRRMGYRPIMTAGPAAAAAAR